MATKKKLPKTSILITDTHIGYCTLAKDSKGFFVEQHEITELPADVISRGEIIKADIVFQIFEKIAETLKNKNIDVVLTNEHFIHEVITLPEPNRKKTLKERAADYFAQSNTSYDWQKTHVCELHQGSDTNADQVLFSCLPQDIHDSYMYIAKKAGLMIGSITSPLLAIDHMIADDSDLILLNKKHTYVISYKQGIIYDTKVFNVSYDQYVKDVVEILSVLPEKAEQIVSQYGVSRNHKDEKVFKKMVKSSSPLLEYLTKKKKNMSDRTSYVMYNHAAVPGFTDMIHKILGSNIHELNVLAIPKYQFHDSLSIMKRDSYQYQSMIAQSLKYWEKEL